MKLWWIVGLSIMTVTVATRALAAGGTQPIKDPDGKTFAQVVVCDSCQSTTDGSKKHCDTGIEDGWLNGNPCGKCMLSENVGRFVNYPYDLHFSGKLVDAAGAPVKTRFVKLFLVNGWTVRTRTGDDGVFRMSLGATQNRKSQKPLVFDLGTFVDSAKRTEYYALYFMPESYKSCPEAVRPAPKAQPAAPKGKGKKH